MTGKFSRIRPDRFSPIVQAIAQAEAGTTGEIRVHLSRRWLERDVFARARHLFERFGMARTANRNAVLLYVNLRRHKFAIIGDEGIHKTVGQRYWEKLAENLSRNLHGTHPERAIAIAVAEVGETLHHFFPVEPEGRNPDELPNVVSED